MKKYGVLLSFFLFTVYLFFPVLKQPNNYLFGYNIDGIKTYYAAQWYINEDNGSHYTGMGWPYGEKLIYTDSKPAIAYGLNALNRLFPGYIGYYTVGIYNILMILSFFLGLILMNRLLRVIGIVPLFAMTGSIIIIGLTSQFMRMEGHYALAYVCYIPALILLLNSVLQKPGKITYPILLAAFILFFAFIHFYYLLLAVLFIFPVLLYAAVTGMYTYTRLSMPAGATLFPVLIVLLYVSYIIPEAERPLIPTGTGHYNASLLSLFLPYRYMIEFNTLASLLPFNITSNFEGQNFLGWLAIPAMLLLIFRLVYYSINRRFEKILQPTSSRVLNLMLFGAVIPLMFSLGLFTPILQVLYSDFMQFRGTGRAAWFFYFAFSTYIVYLLNTMYFKFKSIAPAFTTFITITLFAIWGSSAFQKFQRVSTQIRANSVEEHLAFDISTLQEQLKNHDFQAVIPLPWFHAGTGRLTYFPTNDQLFNSMQVSLHSALPLTSATFARSSFNSGLNGMQLLASPLIEKTILKDLPDDRPFLVVQLNEELNRNEWSLLERSDFLFESRGYSFLKLPPDRLEYDLKELYVNPGRFFDNIVYLDPENTTGENGVYLQYYHDTVSKKLSFSEPNIPAQEIFKEFAPGELNTGTEYEASIWFHINPAELGSPIFALRRINPDGEATEEWKFHNHTYDIFNEWIRYNLRFTPANNEERLQLFAVKEPFTATKLMVRPVEKNVIIQQTDRQRLLINNYPINKPRGPEN